MVKNPFEDSDSQYKVENPFEDQPKKETPPLPTKNTTTFQPATTVPSANDSSSINPWGSSEVVKQSVDSPPPSVNKTESKKKKSKAAEKASAGSGYVASTFGKCMNVSPVFFSLLVAVFLTLLLFGFTCWSLSDKLPSGEHCTQFNPYNPFRIKFTDSSGRKIVTYQCGWRSRNQALRFVMCILAFISPIAVILILNKKWSDFLLWIYVILCFAFAAFFFWAAVIDGQSTQKSRDFWDSYIKTQTFTSQYDSDVKFTLQFWPYIVTVLIDVLVVIAWIVCGLIIGRFKWRGGMEAAPKKPDFDMP